MKPHEFKEMLLPGAIAIEEKYKIPHLFTIAQAALESGWGKYAIGKNLFGIKAGKNYPYKKQLVVTTEYHNTNDVQYPEIISINQLPNGRYKYVIKDWFRDYDTIEECLQGHANVLLLPRYKAAFEHTSDPYLFADEIEKGGYATAPGYANLIKPIIFMLKKMEVA